MITAEECRLVMVDTRKRTLEQANVFAECVARQAYDAAAKGYDSVEVRFTKDETAALKELDGTVGQATGDLLVEAGFALDTKSRPADEEAVLRVTWPERK